MADPALVQALDDLLVVYDFMLRGERAEGDMRRLESVLAPRLRTMTHGDREDLFTAFSERAHDEGWADEGIGEFLDWLSEELGLELPFPG